MSSLMFYQEPVPLDRQAHRGLRLKRQDNLDFARDANAVPVAGVEFFEASRDFPVLFAKDKNGNFVPLALLSLREKGHPLGRTWEGVYMPMYVRRYPFAMSSDGKIIIDKQAPHLQEDEGDRLFNDDGENTEVMDAIARFLGTVDYSIQQTQEFSRECAEKNLFKPFDAQAELEKGKPVNLSRFYAIDEEKVSGLPDEEIVRWFRNGWMPWFFAHLHSQLALHRLVRRERAAEKEGAAGNNGGAGD